MELRKQNAFCVYDKVPRYIQHTGLKGNLSAVEIKNRNIGTWKFPGVEPLRAGKRWKGKPCHHLPGVRYNFP